MLGQFVHSVADGRGVKDDKIKSIADGRVWTGEVAKSMNLVDSIGDFETAVKETATAVGIKGEPTLVRYEKRKEICSGPAVRRRLAVSA